MAVPKRKHSKKRTRTRRAQWKIAAVGTHSCPQCHAPKLPHRVCQSCGTYNGRKVIGISDAE